MVPLINPLTTGRQPPVVFPHSVCIGFPVVVLPKSPPGRLSWPTWESKSKVTPWVHRFAVQPSCPAPPRRRAPPCHVVPRRASPCLAVPRSAPWDIWVLDSTCLQITNSFVESKTRTSHGRGEARRGKAPRGGAAGRGGAGRDGAGRGGTGVEAERSAKCTTFGFFGFQKNEN